MTEITQELMTPPEAAEWFRRSPTWLREQKDLLRVRAGGGQALYHVDVCRAFVFGLLNGLESESLKRVQLRALAAACGLADRAGPEAELAVDAEFPQPPAR